MPHGVNDMIIVLLPKIPHMTTIKDFRPISLCKVVYKIVAKCIVNCLRPLLMDIISWNHSMFILVFLISYKSIISLDCIHHIHSRGTGGDMFRAYKIDLLKAYDRVDWDFLQHALDKCGFSSQRIARVMCAHVKYSAKFNGKLLDRFTPYSRTAPRWPIIAVFIAHCC